MAAETTMKEIHIDSGDQVPADFGPIREAVARVTVVIREPVGVETFPKSWGVLTAAPGVDLVIHQEDGEEYPIKRDIFADTYQEVAPGRYRRSVSTRLVQCPKEVTAILKTKEGVIRVQYPDYIVIGVKNEVYANSAARVADKLTFVG
jgi:hypothetical protein